MEKYVLKVLDNNLGCDYLKTQGGTGASWKAVSDLNKASKFDSISEALNALALNAFKASLRLRWNITIAKIERSGWQEVEGIGDDL